MQRINFKNAVLYKDMVVRAKRSNMSVLIFVINLLLSIAAVITLIVINTSLAGFSSVSPYVLPWFFIIIVFCESALVCLVIPPASSTAISSEREHQTLDVLITTNMRPLEIILGKYLSCLIYVVFVLLSTLPMLSIVFIYGSIGFLQLLAVLGSIIAISMFLASIGIYFSSVCQKSSTATILSFLVFGVLIFGSIVIVLLVALFVDIINSANNLYGSNALSYDPAFFLLYLNPATTVFDALGRTIGYNIDNTGVSGMDYIGENVTNYNASNFFLAFWTPISIVVQLGVSVLFLLGAARNLDPSRKVKYRVRKK